MSNIYDTFRGVQAKKTSCYDERSAAFITEGKMSREITHLRLNEIIRASVVFDDEEGPDEAFVYTLEENNLLRSDYFMLDNRYYLVYEDVKLSFEDIIWKKQKSLECNVNFEVSDETVRAYFLSSLRGAKFNTLEKDAAIMPDQTGLLIVPSRSDLLIGIQIELGGKGWKIKDYDSVSNSGISYIYMERDSLNNVEDDILEPEEEEPQANEILNPMVEYNFETNGAFFNTSVPVNILQRSPFNVKFSVPFGIDTITITTRDAAGDDVVGVYEVIE